MISSSPSGVAEAQDRPYPVLGTVQPNASPLLWLVCALALPLVLAYQIVTGNEIRVLATVLAVLGVLLILARPFWGLVLVLALVYLRPEESIEAIQGMRLTLMVSLVTLVGVWFQLFLSRQAVARTPVNAFIIAFGVTVVVTTLNLGTARLAAQEIAKLVLLVLLTFNLVRGRERYGNFVTALILFTCYISVYSMVLYTRGGAMRQGMIDRSIATGIFADPNDLAATIAGGLALALCRVSISPRTVSRVLYALLSLVMVAAILLTNSRGGMLALLLVVGGWVALFMRNKGLGACLAVIVMLALLALGPSRMTTFDSTEQSANTRFWFWDNGIQLLQEHPLLGVGFRQFPEYNKGFTAHNSFVLAFAELGLIGYYFWMGCFYFAFRRAPRVEEQGEPTRQDMLELRGARLALAGYLMACFWISRTYIPVMYVMMSLPVAQQIASSKVPVHFPASWGQRLKEWAWLLLVCLGSILFIRWMAHRYM